jgi:hypothetical protein
MEFISLSEVIESVAGRVPVEEDWQEIYPEVRDGVPLGGPFKRSMFNSFARTIYRDSMAAATLDETMCNAILPPQWFDVGPTGRPKRSDKGADIATPILEHMANWYKRYGKGIDEQRITLLGNGTEAKEGQFLKPEHAKRFQEIGFDRTEIINFLNLSGIAHSFGDESVLQQTETDVESISRGDSQSAIGQLAMSPNDTADRIITADDASGRSIYRIKTRSGPLDGVIQKARELASDPNNYHAVWLELVKIATGPNPLSPIHGYSDGEVKWQSGDDIKVLSKDALRKRIKPNAR